MVGESSYGIKGIDNTCLRNAYCKPLNLIRRIPSMFSFPLTFFYLSFSFVLSRDNYILEIVLSVTLPQNHGIWYFRWGALFLYVVGHCFLLFFFFEFFYGHFLFFVGVFCWYTFKANTLYCWISDHAQELPAWQICITPVPIYPALIQHLRAFTRILRWSA